MAIKEKVVLNSADICNIIRTCGEVGVREIKYSGFHIHFGTSPKIQSATAPEPETKPEYTIPNKQEAVGVDSLFRSELEEKEERLALMIIEDPEQAEELMMADDLEEFEDAEDIR